MKLNRLKLKLAVIVTGVSVFMFTACNNSDTSGKNSTTDTMSNAPNTGFTTTPDDGSVMPKDNDTARSIASSGKKAGKISITPASMDKSSAMKTDDQGYYNYTETAPVYPGSLDNYINSNLEYPQQAIDNSAEGTVYVTFTIDENGKAGNAKTLGKAIGYGLEEAAVKAVNGMAKWTPGTNKGKNVKAWYTLPITFRMEE